MSILGLIAAFGGGVFAAAIGGVPAFIMTGVFSIVGAAAYAKKKGDFRRMVPTLYLHLPA